MVVIVSEDIVQKQKQKRKKKSTPVWKWVLLGVGILVVLIILIVGIVIFINFQGHESDYSCTSVEEQPLESPDYDQCKDMYNIVEEAAMPRKDVDIRTGKTEVSQSISHRPARTICTDIDKYKTKYEGCLKQQPTLANMCFKLLSVQRRWDDVEIKG